MVRFCDFTFFLSQSQSVHFRDHEQYTCKVVSSIPYTRGNTTCEFTAGCAKHRLLTALVAGYLVCNFAPFSNQQPEANKEKKIVAIVRRLGPELRAPLAREKKVHAWCEPDDLSWVLPIVELKAGGGHGSGRP